ncbi:MAG: hypothetical protein JXO48_01985 [Deltaproteobacteria bacterium]|nr:hypothetical protein [Deltaproteobacteria bacterium]
MAPRRISIGTYDRAQALIRNSEYRKGLEALSGLSQEAGADAQVKEEPDPWVVYDLRKREYLTFSEIARRLSGEKGSISGNKRLHAFYIKVKRAYQKAEHLIDSVSPRD